MNGDVAMDEFVKPLLSLQVDPPAKGAKRFKVDGPGPSCPEYIGQLIHDKKVYTDVHKRCTCCATNTIYYRLILLLLSMITQLKLRFSIYMP